MTPGTIITTALNRSGVRSITDTDKDRARLYLNAVKNDLEGMVEWRWLFKQGTLTTVADQRAYDLASGVSYVISARDTTNDREMRIAHPDDIIRLDPDEDYTGEARILAITGIDASTGVWEADIYPTPDSSSETITYRYYATQADFTSGDDDTEIVTYPKQPQTILLFGTCALMKEDGGGEGRDSSADWNMHQRALQAALRINNQNNTPPRMVVGSTRSKFSFAASITPD